MKIKKIFKCSFKEVKFHNMKRGKGAGVVLLFLILGFIGVVNAAQNPNHPYPSGCTDAGWNIGLPDGIICTGTSSLQEYEYQDFTECNYPYDLLKPNLVSVNKLCQDAFGTYSYAKQATIHGCCTGECGEVNWNNNQWNCYTNYPGDPSVGKVLYCATGCCTPKTCANYPGQCGSALANGTCSGTINCANACTGGLVCNPTSGLCVSPITAHSCSSPSQTIMKLDEKHNSLGALWNNASATFDICYDEIFNKTYTKSNPHDCNSGNRNKVLNLQEASDSLAEIPSEDNYNVPVCYGDLQCRNALSCAADEKIVVRLNDTVIAHISNASDISFPILICCKNRFQITNGANWTNMDDDVIYKADLRDSVKLMVFGEGIEDKNINYTVYKEGAHWWNRDKVVSQTSTKGYFLWEKAEPNGTYYFKAQVEGESDWKQSNDLEISDRQNNSNPSIVIIKPIDETNYIINETAKRTANLDFEQISHDEDDDLDVIWDFGDLNSTRFSNCEANNCNTTHSYNKSGVKMIIATAREKLRWQNKSDSSRIFIYQKGLNIFAIIDSPDYKDVPQTIGTFLINGTSSHVANCTFSSSECNDTADNYSPVRSCYEIIDNQTSLKIYCYKFAESSAPGFGFQWRINGDIDEEHANQKYFNKTFSVPRKNNIVLKVNYTYS